MTRATKQELLQLLEALCEERLSAEQTLRLESIVLAHHSARRLYLDYVHLHGTLLWDAARADETITETVAPSRPIADGHSPKSRPASKTRPVSDDSRRLRRRHLWSVAVAVLGLLLIVGTLWFGSGQNATSLDPGQAVVENHSGGTPDAVSDDESRELPESGPDRYYKPIDLGHGAVAKSHTPPVVAPRPDLPVRMPKDLVAFINRQIAEQWHAAGVEPSDRAGDSAWLRRVTLDLAGRIPTPGEVTRFLEDDDPRRRRAVVARLLASKGFNRNFATIWTNLLVGRATEESTPANRGALWQFFERSFAAHRPWDETVARIVAAEGPINKNPASNFLVAHLNNKAVPATAIVARTFLGTQVQCMQCHNHPFNDWTQRDFWEFNAFFKQVRITKNEQGIPTLVSAKVGGPTLFETRQGIMKAAYPIFHGTQIPDDPSVDRRQRLAALMATGEKTQLAEAFVNRMWAHFFGFGFTRPVDDMGPHNPPTHPLVLDRLSRAFVDSGYDVRQLVRWITATRPYQLSSRFRETNRIDTPAIGSPALFSRVYPQTMTVEQAYNSLLVATRTEPESTLKDVVARNDWAMQFIEAYQTDENNESVRFAGTIPAALALMNGRLTQAGLKPRPGTRLRAIVTSGDTQSEKLNRLALATLSRRLTDDELAAFNQLIRRRLQATPPAQRPAAHLHAIQDVLWAMLNSAEFLTVP